MQELTREQAAIIAAYTGISCGPFAEFHEYCEKLLGHPIWTHQFPSLVEKIKVAAKEDFLKICRRG